MNKCPKCGSTNTKPIMGPTADWKCLDCGYEFFVESFQAEVREKTHSAKWQRCVDKVAAQGGVESPEAVCTAALGDESYESYEDADIMEKVSKTQKEQRMSTPLSKLFQKYYKRR